MRPSDRIPQLPLLWHHWHEQIQHVCLCPPIFVLDSDWPSNQLPLFLPLTHIPLSTNHTPNHQVCVVVGQPSVWCVPPPVHNIHNLLLTETVQVTCGNHGPYHRLDHVPALLWSHTSSSMSYLISAGDIPAGIVPPGPHQSNPHPSARGVDRRHTMLDHSPAHCPVNYPQPGRTHSMLSDSSLKRVSTGNLNRGPGDVQHVAIAERDIIGWTEDGRLLVQMQAPGMGGARAVGGVDNPTPTRRASTGMLPLNSRCGGSCTSTCPVCSPGQFPPSFGPHPPKADGSTLSSPVHHNLPTPSTSTFEPPRKIFYHPPYDHPAPRHRPLPLTPLDIAMPQSHAMRTRRITHPVANGNIAVERPVTMVTNESIKQASVQGQSVASKQDPVTGRRHGTPFSSHSSSCSPPSSPDPITDETTPPPPSHHHNNSADATLQEVTDQMSRALAQFDDLLGVAQTTL